MSDPPQELFVLEDPAASSVAAAASLPSVSQVFYELKNNLEATSTLSNGLLETFRSNSVPCATLVRTCAVLSAAAIELEPFRPPTHAHATSHPRLITGTADSLLRLQASLTWLQESCNTNGSSRRRLLRFMRESNTKSTLVAMRTEAARLENHLLYLVTELVNLVEESSSEDIGEFENPERQSRMHETCEVQSGPNMVVVHAMTAVSINSPVRSVAVEKSLVLFGTQDGSVGIVNLRTGELLRVDTCHEGVAVTAVALSPDENFFVTGGADGTVKIWSVFFGTLKMEAIDDNGENARPHAECLRSIFVTSGGDVISSEDVAGNCSIWHIDWSALVIVRGTGSKHETSLTMEPAEEGEVEFRLDLGAEARFVSRNTGLNVICEDEDESLGVDESPTTLASSGRSLISCIAWSIDQQKVVIGLTDGSMDTFFQGSSEVRPVPEVHDGAVTALCLNPEGSILVSGASSGSLWMFDIGNAVSGTHELEGHSGAINCIGMSNLCEFIVTGSDDCSMRIWNISHSPF